MTGNFSVRSVYTVPLVSANKNAMKTLCVFASGKGAISSSSGLLSSLYVDLTFFHFRSRCYFSVDIDGSKYLVKSLLFIPGHVTK